MLINLLGLKRLILYNCVVICLYLDFNGTLNRTGVVYTVVDKDTQIFLEFS